VGRNRAINGDFSVNQRGFTTLANPAGAFGFDRWQAYQSGGTCSYSAQTPALGDLPESARAYARVVTSGQSAAGDYAILYQKIESVRTLSGKTANVSFWARAASGTPKVVVEFTQIFGLGGSPSTTVTIYVGTVTLSTVWRRYSVTCTFPSIAGKTLGSNGDDHIQLFFWTSAGSTYSARIGSLGIQSATIDFWGVQVEEGPYSTAYEQKTYADELRACRRYYQRLLDPPMRGGVASATTLSRMGMLLQVPMRAAPNATITGTAYVYDGSSGAPITSVANWYNSPDSVEMDAVASGGAFTIGRASAWYRNGAGSGYLNLDAELP
jgi:hypothetical protein